MSYIQRSSFVTHMGQTWWVNALPSGLYARQMKRMLDQIHAMFSHHNKLNIIRFDLHQSLNTDNSDHVSLFFKRLVAALKQKHKIKRVGYAWARETENVKNQHYHCILILDGNVIQHPHHIFTQAKLYWEVYHDGYLCWPPERCFYNVRRGDRSELQKAIYHISYLAKARGKGKKPEQAKNYGVSQVRIKVREPRGGISQPS